MNKWKWWYFVPVYILLLIGSAIPFFLSWPEEPMEALGFSILFWIRLTINAGLLALLAATIAQIVQRKSVFKPTFHVVFIAAWIVLAVFFRGGPRFVV